MFEGKGIIDPERAMLRAMCGVKLIDMKTTEELMDMLGQNEALDKLAKANGVQWYWTCVEKRI